MDTHSLPKLAVFGASRGVGLEFTRLALEAGHPVQALVRNPTQMPLAHPALEAIQGDATSTAAVRETIAGCDAVICALGAPAFSSSRVRSEGARKIVEAMRELGARRLVCLSVLGAGETRQDLPFLFRYVIFPTYLRRPVADHERQEAIVRESGLDWTLVRPPNLTDGPRTGTYAHGFSGGEMSRLTLQISRADVADFMLRQLTASTYLHAAPGLSYAKAA